jgi:hypothetical protein
VSIASASDSPDSHNKVCLNFFPQANIIFSSTRIFFNIALNIAIASGEKGRMGRMGIPLLPHSSHSPSSPRSRATKVHSHAALPDKTAKETDPEEPHRELAVKKNQKILFFYTTEKFKLGVNITPVPFQLEADSINQTTSNVMQQKIENMKTTGFTKGKLLPLGSTMLKINMGMQPMPRYLINFHEKEMVQQKSQEENIIEEETEESMGRKMGESERSREQLSILKQKISKRKQKKTKKKKTKRMENQWSQKEEELKKLSNSKYPPA